MKYETFLEVGAEGLFDIRDNNPDNYEQEVKELINDFLENHVPEEQQQRLKQFQWTLEGDLRKYKDPIARFNRMVELFYQGLDKFNGTLQECGFTGNNEEDSR